MAKDVGQKQRPTLLDAPLLRDEIKPAQGFAYQLDGFDQQLFFIMLEADFDRALAAMTRHAGNSTQQPSCRPAPPGLPSVGKARVFEW